MAQLQGSSVELRVGFESAYGITTTTGYKIPFAPTLDAMTEQSINQSSIMDGNASPNEPFLGFKDGKFSASIPMDTKAFPVFLKGAFGSPTTTDNGDSTYTHVFKIGLTVPSMFCEIIHGDATGGLVYRTKGIGINTMSFSLGGDGELLVNVAGIAKDTEKATTSVISTLTDATDGVVFGQFQAGITGVNKVKSIDLNYNNNISTDQYIIDGTGTRGGVPKGTAEVSGSLTALMEDDTLYAISRGFTTTPITITMTNGTNEIEFSMPETKFNAVSNGSISSPAGIEASLNYSAFYKANANATALMISVTNSSATI